MKKYNEGGMLTEFNAGGTHEENPNGGIPLGQDALVEQGETRFEDFIFSDSIKINKLLAKEFNLPKKLIGKSFADASKHYNDKERPNDVISKRGNTKELQNLMEAQEAFKQVEQQEAEQAQPANDPMGGMGEQMNEMMTPQTMKYGGQIFQGAASGAASGANIGASVGIAKGLAAGAAAGSVVPVAGTAIGAGIGLLAGGAASYFAAKNADDRLNSEMKANASERVFKYGGKMKYRAGGPFDNIDEGVISPIFDFSNTLTTINNTQSENSLTNVEGPNFNNTSLNLNKDFKKPYVAPFSLNKNDGVLGENERMKSVFGNTSLNLNKSNTTDPNTKLKTTNTETPNYSSLLRFTPVATGLASAATIAANKPEMRGVDDFTNQDFLSPNYLQSEQMESAVRRETDKNRNMISQVGGSSAQMASNLMGASLQGSRAVADANLGVQQYNVGEKSRVEAGNSQINASNNQVRMANREANRADRAAYLSALMNELNNTGMNVGQVGTESYRMKQAKEMGLDFYTDVYGNLQYLGNPNAKKTN